MAVKISPRRDSPSEEQRVNQNTTDDEVKATASMSFLISISESVSRRHYRRCH